MNLFVLDCKLISRWVYKRGPGNIPGLEAKWPILAAFTVVGLGLSHHPTFILHVVLWWPYDITFSPPSPVQYACEITRWPIRMVFSSYKHVLHEDAEMLEGAKPARPGGLC